jgi:hypothetical protein
VGPEQQKPAIAWCKKIGLRERRKVQLQEGKRRGQAFSQRGVFRTPSSSHLNQPLTHGHRKPRHASRQSNALHNSRRLQRPNPREQQHPPARPAPTIIIQAAAPPAPETPIRIHADERVLAVPEAEVQRRLADVNIVEQVFKQQLPTGDTCWPPMFAEVPARGASFYRLSDMPARFGRHSAWRLPAPIAVCDGYSEVCKT